jgi:hypothetical protein
MTKNIFLRTLSLTSIFIKEQLKEPIAFFWIMISPCAMFYFFAVTRQDTNYFSNNYTSISAWFYAYISSSVALFGFSFYIIGRRESGFTRSFIYSQESKLVFSCILLNINSVLHNFLPDNQTPVWRLCPDRTIGYRAPLLHLLYHVLRFWRSVFIAANQLSKLKHITLHFFVLHVNSGSDERQ